MYKGKRVVVITPAYNEEKHIIKVIEGLPSFVDHIVIVDDCSKDKTSLVVKEYLKSKALVLSGSKSRTTTVTKETEENSDSRVILIRHEKNTGIGGAIKTAINKARLLKADITVTMAGDNQMNPSYLPDLLDPICEEKYDFVKGNRFYSVEGLANMPKHRIFGSMILTFMTRVASGYWNMIDPQNGYVAYGPKMLRELDFNHLVNGYALENDILINANILGLRLKEVPIPAVYQDEKSTMNLWKIVPSFSVFLFTGFFRRIFKKYFLRGIHPVFIFFFSGLVLASWGLIFGLVVWHHSFVSHIAATTGTVMLSVVPFLMGFEMLLWSIVLDIQDEPK